MTRIRNVDKELGGKMCMPQEEVTTAIVRVLFGR